MTLFSSKGNRLHASGVRLGAKLPLYHWADGAGWGVADDWRLGLSRQSDDLNFIERGVAPPIEPGCDERRERHLIRR
jgi:hypothetical protein